MENELNRLFSELDLRSHLLAMLPSKPFNSCIRCGDEEWLISLSEEKVYYQKGLNGRQLDLEITGDMAMLMVLLNGEVRLSQLKKMGNVQVEGSFRHLLLMEAILWLCRKYEDITETDPVSAIESF